MQERELDTLKLEMIAWVCALKDESTLAQLIKIQEEHINALREELKEMIKNCDNPDLLNAVKLLAESHLRQKGDLE